MYSLIFGVQFEISTILVNMFAQVIRATAFCNNPDCSMSVIVSAGWMGKKRNLQLITNYRSFRLNGLLQVSKGNEGNYNREDVSHSSLCGVLQSPCPVFFLQVQFLSR